MGCWGVASMSGTRRGSLWLRRRGLRDAKLPPIEQTQPHDVSPIRTPSVALPICWVKRWLVPTTRSGRLPITYLLNGAEVPCDWILGAVCLLRDCAAHVVRVG